MGVPSASGVESWIVDLAGRPETYVAVAVVLALGAVVTLLPTQSLVVAVGALLIARGDPLGPLVLLAAATVVGMVAGDLLAYAVARVVLRVGDHRHRPSRRLPRVLASIDARVRAMRVRFDRNPSATMIIGRLVPAGRVATDLLAADARVTLPAFIGMTAAGAGVFALFCIALAGLAGPFVHRAPLAVTAGAVVASLLTGVAIDAIDRRLQQRRQHAAVPPLHG